MLEFPSKIPEINMVYVSDDILKVVGRLLKTVDFRLIQADTWIKYGQTEVSAKSNNEQRMHCDYGNNTFLHPVNWNTPEQVAAIIYYSDSDECAGGTAVVPRRGEEDPAYKFPLINQVGYGHHVIANTPKPSDFMNDKDTCEKYFEKFPKVHAFRQSLYKREIKASFKPGTMLLYRMDIWHRGTAVAADSHRIVQNLAWARNDCPWYGTWNSGFARKMYMGYLENFISGLNTRQLTSIGWPVPSNEHWANEKLIEYIQARYPDMDLSDYVVRLDPVLYQ